MTASKHFILIGHPVGHSVSPAIHQAVYYAHRLSHRYTAVDCPDEAAVQAQVERLRRGEIHGANVTVPWKQVALALADVVDPSAEVTGAANVLLLRDGKIEAHNTDAPALARLLQAGAQAAGQEEPRSALILGTGGAALGAVYACRLCGVERVMVSGRKWLNGAGSPSQGWAKSAQFQGMGATPIAWSPETVEDNELPTVGGVASQVDVIVQASSAGMLGIGQGESVAELIPWRELRSSCYVYDVVYNPPRTPFLASAEGAGVHAEGGLSMLVGQAALAIELWLHLSPDREGMMAAARRAIFGDESAADSVEQRSELEQKA